MNIFFPPNQQYILILMLFCGMVIGVLFDLFELKRRLSSNLRFIVYIDDVLFTFLSAVIFVVYVFVFNNGILRWYEFLFTLVGVMLYKLTLSKLVLLIFGFLADIIKQSLLFIVKQAVRLVNKVFSFFMLVIVFALNLLKPLFVRLIYIFSFIKFKKMIIKFVTEVN